MKYESDLYDSGLKVKPEKTMTLREYLDENFAGWYTQNKLIRESMDSMVLLHRIADKSVFWIEGYKWNIHISKSKKGPRVVPF